MKAIKTNATQLNDTSSWEISSNNLYYYLNLYGIKEMVYACQFEKNGCDYIERFGTKTGYSVKQIKND